MLAAAANVDTEFAAQRAAARAWNPAVRAGDPGWELKSEPPIVLEAGVRPPMEDPAAHNGFAALYHAGGDRVSLEPDTFDFRELVIGPDWLDRRLEDLGVVSEPPQPAEQPAKPDFGASIEPFRSDASPHPMRTMLKEIGDAAMVPELIPDETVRQEPAQAHRRRGLRRVAMTFKGALMSFLALHLMTEMAHSEEARTGWLDDMTVDGVASGVYGMVQVPIMTMDAINAAYEVFALTVAPDRVTPISVADLPFGDEFVVFKATPAVNLSGAGDSLELVELLGAEDPVLTGKPETPAPRAPVEAEAPESDVAPVAVPPRPLLDELLGTEEAADVS